ncbi:hypothetical protein C362_04749 [Cryptococcus neoformans Bt1]|nr:hypothetical protein C362_04749 [Cryptococcus neoformans var. grubii Bt1]OXC65482.1 hypothetical protein AYX13_05491 [Cryptococcus neoformans var. grubii]OXG35307.1 hypothetical protein C367_00545 [Cryptococcus neoformans var. grubii Ze90-1]
MEIWRQLSPFACMTRKRPISQPNCFYTPKPGFLLTLKPVPKTTGDITSRQMVSSHLPTIICLVVFLLRIDTSPRDARCWEFERSAASMSSPLVLIRCGM